MEGTACLCHVWEHPTVLGPIKPLSIFGADQRNLSIFCLTERVKRYGLGRSNQ